MMKKYKILDMERKTIFNQRKCEAKLWKFLKYIIIFILTTFLISCILVNIELNDAIQMDSKLTLRPDQTTDSGTTTESSSESSPQNTTELPQNDDNVDNRVSIAGPAECETTKSNCSLYCRDGNVNWIDNKLSRLRSLCPYDDFSLIIQNGEFPLFTLSYSLFFMYDYTYVYFSICDSDLQIIYKSAFKHNAVKNLQTLILRNNMITTLGATTFEGLGSLKYFEFVQQPLKAQLKAEEFLRPMAPSLTKAVITQMTNEQTITNPRNWLQGSELTSLLSLDMSNNNFRDIFDSLTFRTLIAIENLVLVNCSLSAIADKTFDVILNTLKFLDLSNNHIKILDLQLLNQLATYNIEINLVANEWYCDCENIEMIEFFQANEELAKTIVCNAPEEWENMELTEFIMECEKDATTISSTTIEVTTITTEISSTVTSTIIEISTTDPPFPTTEISSSTTSNLPIENTTTESFSTSGTSMESSSVSTSTALDPSSTTEISSTSNNSEYPPDSTEESSSTVTSTIIEISTTDPPFPTTEISSSTTSNLPIKNTTTESLSTTGTSMESSSVSSTTEISSTSNNSEYPPDSTIESSSPDSTMESSSTTTSSIPDSPSTTSEILSTSSSNISEDFSTSTTEISSTSDHSTDISTGMSSSTKTTATSEDSTISTVTTEISPTTNLSPNAKPILCIHADNTEAIHWFDYIDFRIITTSASSVAIEIPDTLKKIDILYFSNYETYTNLSRQQQFNVTRNMVNINQLIPGITYTFCLVADSQLAVSPFQCQSHYIKSITKPWLLVTDQSWLIPVTIVICLIVLTASIFVVFIMLRKHPNWLLNHTQKILKNNNDQRHDTELSKKLCSKSKDNERSSNYLTPCESKTQTLNSDHNKTSLYASKYTVPEVRAPIPPPNSSNRKSSCPSYHTAQQCEMASKYVSVQFNRFQSPSDNNCSIYTTHHTVPKEMAPNIPSSSSSNMLHLNRFQPLSNQISSYEVPVDIAPNVSSRLLSNTNHQSVTSSKDIQHKDDDQDYQSIDHYEIVDF